MSSAPAPAASNDARMEGTVDTIRSATKDDYVVWENRKHPLKVFETSTDEDGNYQMSVVGVNNGRLSIKENYAEGSNTPAPRASNNETIRGLRFASDEEVREGWGDEAAAEVTNGRSPRGRDGDGDSDNNPEGQRPEMRNVGDMVVPEEMIEEHDDGSFSIRGDDESELVSDNGTPEPSGEEFDGDGDEYAKERLDDPFATFDDLLEAMNADPVLDNAETYFEREYNVSHTWVDELVAFGQDIPKAAGGWVLIDYGLAQTPGRRKLAWANQKTDELLALTAHRPDDGPMTYNLFHQPLPEGAEQVDIHPELTTTSGNEALNAVRNKIYDGVNNVDIEFIEQRDGSVQVRSDVNNATLGTRVMQRLGVDIKVPSAQDAKTTLFDTIRPGVKWAQNNSESVGSALLFAVEATVAGLSKRFIGAEVRPVIEPDEIGVEVNGAYKYKGEKADFVNIDAAVTGSGGNPQQIYRILSAGLREPRENESRQEALERIAKDEFGMADRKLDSLANQATSDGSTDVEEYADLLAAEIAESAATGAKLTFDPAKFDLDTNNRLPEAVNMDFLVSLSNRLNISDRVSLQVADMDGSTSHSESPGIDRDGGGHDRDTGPDGDPREIAEDVPMSVMKVYTTASMAHSRKGAWNNAAHIVQACGLNNITPMNEVDLGRELRNADDQRQEDILFEQAITYAVARHMNTGSDFNVERTNNYVRDHHKEIVDTIESSDSALTSWRDYFHAGDDGVEDLIERVLESAEDLAEESSDGGDGGDSDDEDGGSSDGGDGGDSGGDGGGSDSSASGADPQAVARLKERVQDPEAAPAAEVIRQAADESASKELIENAALMGGHDPEDFLSPQTDGGGGPEQGPVDNLQNIAQTYTGEEPPESGTGDPDAGESLY